MHNKKSQHLNQKSHDKESHDKESPHLNQKSQHLKHALIVSGIVYLLSGLFVKSMPLRIGMSGFAGYNTYETMIKKTHFSN